jgi:L-ribulose-5-phosphate 4-epimerase
LRDENMKPRTYSSKVAEEYLWAVRRSFQLGLQTGSGGNITLRLGTDRFLTKPTGVGLVDCGVDDLILVNGKGEVVEGAAPPTKEILVHLSLFEVRSDVNAIVHCHASYATAYAVRGRTLPLPTIHAKRILGKIPLVEEYPEGSDQLAYASANAAMDPNVRGLLMKGHGLIALGGSLRQAQYRAELMEESARIAWLSQFISQCASEIAP